jgi:hypothetical protein
MFLGSVATRDGPGTTKAACAGGLRGLLGCQRTPEEPPADGHQELTIMRTSSG